MKRTSKALFLLCTFVGMSMCTSCILFPHHHDGPRHERRARKPRPPKKPRHIKKAHHPKKSRHMAKPQHQKKHHRRWFSYKRQSKIDCLFYYASFVRNYKNAFAWYFPLENLKDFTVLKIKYKTYRIDTVINLQKKERKIWNSKI